MANYHRAQSKQNNRAALMVVVLLLVAVCLVVATFLLLMPTPDKEPAPPLAAEMSASADPAAAEGPLPGLELQRETDFPEDEFHYLLNAAPVFNKKGEKGRVYLENCSGNRGYMQVVYTLEESGEEIYASPLLPPNWNIQVDDLDVQPQRGEYRAIASVYVYESADAEQYTALFKETIHITVG